MLMSAAAVQRGDQTIGDFVLIQLYLIQLHPLTFIGSVYREIRQSITDLEVMFDSLNSPVEVADMPDAPALQLVSSQIRFDNVHFPLRS